MQTSSQIYECLERWRLDNKIEKQQLKWLLNKLSEILDSNQYRQYTITDVCFAFIFDG